MRKLTNLTYTLLFFFALTSFVHAQDDCISQFNGYSIHKVYEVKSAGEITLNLHSPEKLNIINSDSAIQKMSFNVLDWITVYTISCDIIGNYNYIYVSVDSWKTILSHIDFMSQQPLATTEFTKKVYRLTPKQWNKLYSEHIKIKAPKVGLSE